MDEKEKGWLEEELQAEKATQQRKEKPKKSTGPKTPKPASKDATETAANSAKKKSTETQKKSKATAKKDEKEPAVAKKPVKAEQEQDVKPKAEEAAVAEKDAETKAQEEAPEAADTGTREKDDTDAPAELDDSLCRRCQEQARGTKKDPDSAYCADCVQAMKRTKVGWESILVLVAFLAFFVLASLYLVLQMPIVAEAAKGEVARLQSRYTDAANAYVAAMETASEQNARVGDRHFVDYGNKTMIRYLKAVGRVAPLEAGYYAQQAYPTEKDREGFAMRKMREYAVLFESYSALSEEVQGLLSGYMEAGDVPYEETVKSVEALNTDGKYPQYIVEYYKYLLADLTGQDTEARLAHLQKVEELEPEAIWLYGNGVIQIYHEMAQYDKALEYCERWIQTNLNLTRPYRLKALNLIAQENYDAVLAVADTVEEINGNTALPAELRVEIYRRKGEYDTAINTSVKAIEAEVVSIEIYRQYAIALLLKGDYTNAAKYAYEAYSQQVEVNGEELTTDVANTFVICAHLDTSGNETYAALKDAIAKDATQLLPKTQELLDGKTTVVDIFTKGTGDVL